MLGNRLAILITTTEKSMISSDGKVR